MRDVDGVLAAIDQSCEDWTVSRDAMRSGPSRSSALTPAESADVLIALSGTTADPFLVGFQRVMVALAAFVRALDQSGQSSAGAEKGAAVQEADL